MGPKITHPLTVVRLEKNLDDRIGCAATRISYITQRTIPQRPRIRGTRTCTDVHENWTPPQVSPSNADELAAMIMRLPLSSVCMRATRTCEIKKHTSNLFAEAFVSNYLLALSSLDRRGRRPQRCQSRASLSLRSSVESRCVVHNMIIAYRTGRAM